ncbi:MAG: efflux RND transporter periplasmic adaptor subunit [Ignavibacteria bacterium]|nr:efflux RND transporter periplasmic adaptor subunit [Ignavibacteria bacterium]
MKKIFSILIVVISISNWNCTSSHNEETQPEKITEQKRKTYYTCPMHPSVRSDKPGACPVCNMSLVEVTETENEETHSEHKTLGDVSLSPSKQVLANVSTTKAERMKLTKEISAVGTINYAEPNFKQITMRFPGRLERVYLNCCTGQKVAVGDPVAEVYSPDVISAQKEFLLAFNSYKEVQQIGIDLSDAQNLFEQAKQKLFRYGLTEEQISELEKTKEVQEIFTMYSPVEGTVTKSEFRQQHYASIGEPIFDVVDLSSVWLYINVFENELHFVKTGQGVEATTEVYPNEKFIGKIIFISPSVDATSRTVRMRVEFSNEDEKLKLEMYINAKIKINLQEEIVVPFSSIISTGNRTVVYVQKSEKVFEPRIVTLGAKAENYVQILSGIEEGENIVTSGGYLLDSESQLQMGIINHESH